MKAMTILIRCRHAEGDMRRIRQRIQQRREAAESITPKVAGTGGGHGTSEPDRLASMMAAIDELEAELEARAQAYLIELAVACVLLDALPANESAVLHEYYVRQRGIPATAKKKKYTEGYIRKIKADGEKLIEQIPPPAVAGALPAWYVREWPEEGKSDKTPQKAEVKKSGDFRN